MTKDEKNRAIGEWLGWTTKPQRTREGLIWYAPNGGYSLEAPDFYLSEEASALVLEKIKTCQLEEDFHLEHMKGCGWSVLTCYANSNFGGEWNNTIATHADRKTAIAEAALALIQQEKK